MLYKSVLSKPARHRLSHLDCNLLSPREEERLLKGARLARFRAADAIKRVELELRRARRARSRKLYAFWSAARAQIATPAKESSIRKRAEENEWTIRSRREASAPRRR
jgi:hypothetical protein